MEGGANYTLYVSGLVGGIKAADLVALLYELFSSYGEVISVVIAKGNLRGTAFVSFKSLAQSTAAFRNLKSFDFLGKELKIDFAKSKSDAVSKFQGNFKPRFKPVRKSFQFDNEHNDMTLGYSHILKSLKVQY